MKNILNTILKHVAGIYLGILMVLLANSCMKDQGNYIYESIDSIHIGGLVDEYQIPLGSTLGIVPQISFDKRTFNADEFTYEWITFDTRLSRNEQRKLISNEKNFEKKFPFGIGTYDAFFRVTEKSTGLSWTKDFKIKVEGTYSGGWAVLSEVDGNSRLSYFQYDRQTGLYPTVYPDFGKMIISVDSGKTLNLPGKPKFVQHWQNSTGATGQAQLLYIGTEQLTTKINTSKGFEYKETFDFKFESANPAVLSKVEEMMPATSLEGFAYANKNVYVANSTYQMLFGSPINRLSTGEIFNVAATTAVRRSSSNSILMYDTTNKRFVRSNTQSTSSSAGLAYTAGVSAFDPNSVGMELVWMGQTEAFGGYAYAVFTDNNGKYYLARMVHNASFSAKAWEEISSLPGIAEAKLFAIDNQFGYLQYAVGGKIYQYDVDTKATKLMQDYGNRKISVLKYHDGIYISTQQILTSSNPELKKRYTSAYLGLICATYDPASPDNTGKVDVFNVPQFNADYILYYSLEANFGRVADVTSVDVPSGF